MAFKTYKFRDTQEMDLFLNGGIICGNDRATSGISDLVGKTLTFTSPVGAVTFAAVPARDDPDKLFVTDIKAQIEAAIPQVRVLNLLGRIAFIHTTAGVPVSFGAAVEPARILLGLPRSGAITGRIVYHDTGHAPAVTPRFVGSHVYEGSWVVTVWE